MAAVAHNREFAARVGISQSVGREFNDADRRQGLAGGGKVKSVRDLQAALDLFKENKLPQKGFFSTLDELVATAPQESMPAYQWAKYLAPGRKLNRDGTEFPLKQEELNYTKMGELAQAAPDRSLSKEELRKILRANRPDIGISTYVTDSDLGGFDDPKSLDYRARRGMRTPGREDPHIDEAQYDEEGLRHAGIPGSYEESVTVSPDVGDFSSHFSPQDISWSRTTRHQLPEGNAETLRLIEEIQSDRHSAAAERKTRPILGGSMAATGDPDGPRQVLGHERLPERVGYRTPEQDKELSDRTPAYNASSPNRRNWTDEQAANSRRLDELRAIPPDAPFKDPRDYATLETRKQLLNAVADNDRFLGLTRGADQVQRYSQGMDSRRTAGMEKMYDELYPSVLKKEAGRYGAEMRDVEVPTISHADTRPSSFVEGGAETFEDFIEGLNDYEDGTDIADRMRDLLSDYEQGLVNDPYAKNHFGKALRQIHKVGGFGEKTDSDEFQKAYSDAAATLYTIHGFWNAKNHNTPTSVAKSFPAAEITPEVADRIRRIGVPIFKFGAGAVGADQMLNRDDEPQPGFAEGGSVPKKTLDYWRSVANSLGHAVPGPESTKTRASNLVARPMSGFASQVLTRGENGMHLGAHPGIIDEVKSTPALLDLVGLSGAVPDFAHDATDAASANHEDTQAGMGLGAPEGLVENGLDALGTMAGQLPIPGSNMKRLSQLLDRSKLLKGAKKIVGPAAEWFSPSVDPTNLHNYTKGAGVGGALGAAGSALGARATQAQNERFMHDAMKEVLRDEAQGTDADDDAALAEAGYAEGGKVRGALELINKLRRSTDSTDIATRKAALDQAAKRMTAPGSQIPFERRAQLHQALAGASDAASDLQPARRQQRFGDYERNILSLLENTAPTLADPTFDPAITERLLALQRQAPPPPTIGPSQAPYGHGTQSNADFAQATAQRLLELQGRAAPMPPIRKASGGLTGYAPATQAQKSPGAPSTTNGIDYEHYGEGPEQLFMGDRRISLPEGWAPQHTAAPGAPRATGGGSNSLLPVLGVAGLAAYDWYNGRNGSGAASGIGGSGSMDDISNWNEASLQGIAPPDGSALPGWWDTIKGYGQGALGALGVYGGVQQGGTGGYGQALSGAGDVSDALGQYGGGYGDSLGGAGDVLSGIDRGGVEGYGQAAAGGAQLADSFGYDQFGNYVPIVGGLLGAYNGSQQGGPGGVASTASGLYNAGTAAGVLSAPAGGAGTMAAGSGVGGALGAVGSVAGPVALGFAMAEIGNQLLGTGREGPSWQQFSNSYKDLGITQVGGRIPAIKLPGGQVIRVGTEIKGNQHDLSHGLRDAYLGGGTAGAQYILSQIPPGEKDVEKWWAANQDRVLGRA